ncbi:MAG: hypoxanthine phosphoribosyltransferase [Desulfobacterales bacterium]
MNFISTSKKGSDAVDTRKWLLIPVEQIDAPIYAKIGIEGILITEGRIKERVRKNAAEIKDFYHAKKIDEIYAIGVLKGASRILNELTTELGRGEDGMSAEIDYTELRSYEKDKSTGNVKLIKDLSGSIRGRHVLVIEDILDTGVTFNYLLNHIEAKHPASLNTYILLDKPERRHPQFKKFEPNFCGFTVRADAFVVGHGIDYEEKYRNYPHVAVVKVP